MKNFKFQISNFKSKKEEIPHLGLEDSPMQNSLFSKKASKKVFITAGGALIILLILIWFFAVNPVLTLKDNLQKSQGLFAEAQQGLSEKNLPFLEEKISQGTTLLANCNQPLKKLAWLKIIPKIGGYYRNGKLILESADYLSQSITLTIEAISSYTDILGFKNGQEATSSGETTQGRIQFLLESGQDLAGKIDDIHQNLNLANDKIQEINPQYLPDEFQGIKIKEKFDKIKETLEQANQLMGGSKSILENLSYFLGKEEPRTYLVLFQNNAELRSSGGFLTAYALLKVDNGQPTPLLSQDIYDLDNRLNKRIEAPRPIKDYLPNVYYWNLRDMNLSPDFKVSMENFYQYYQTIPQVYEADGILAVDTQFLADLLSVLGPIGVPSWGTFSSESDDRCFGCPQVIYELERLADKPTSEFRTDRKAVIGPLMHSILLNMMGASAEKMPKLFEALITSIEEKHVLFYFPQEEKQEAIEGLNLGGRIKETDSDYFHLNDTNFAGAKSNMFIEETIEQKITVESDGSIIREVKVKYQNPAPPSDCNLESGGLCLNGLYRNWFRFYVPKGSTLLEMKGSEVEPLVYEELEKTVFEGFFGDKYPLHPQGGVTLVSIKYKLPFEYKNQDSYSLLIQKQPGTKNHHYQVSYGKEVKEFDLNKDRILSW